MLRPRAVRQRSEFTLSSELDSEQSVQWAPSGINGQTFYDHRSISTSVFLRHSRVF